MFLEAQAGWRLSSRKGQKEPKGIVVRRLGFDSRMPNYIIQFHILSSYSFANAAVFLSLNFI